MAATPELVVEQRGDGLAGIRLRSASGQILARSDRPLPVGSPVLVALRAEDLALEPPASAQAQNGCEGAIRCRVVSCLSVGDSVECTLKVGGERLAARVPEGVGAGEQALPPGASTWVRFPPGRTVALATARTVELPEEDHDVRPAAQAPAISLETT